MEAENATTKAIRRSNTLYWHAKPALQDSGGQGAPRLAYVEAEAYAECAGSSPVTGRSGERNWLVGRETGDKGIGPVTDARTPASTLAGVFFISRCSHPVTWPPGEYLTEGDVSPSCY